MSGFYNIFLSHLRDTGVSKVSHFNVMIPIPSVVTGKRFENMARIISFRCEAADLPGRQLVNQDVKIYGTPYKVPHGSLYQELTLNFLETGDFLIRDFFERWIGAIFQESNNTLAYPNSYRVDMSLKQYGISLGAGAEIPEGKGASGTVRGADGLPVLAEWQLVDAFPTAVNQMPVSWADDGFARVAVTMAYEYYMLFTSEGGPLEASPTPSDALSPRILRDPEAQTVLAGGQVIEAPKTASTTKGWMPNEIVPVVEKFKRLF